MNQPTLIKNFTAGGQIFTARGVSIDGTTAFQCDSSATAMGVSIHAAEVGERIDVALDGIAEIEHGGNVSAGDYLTCDSDGKAVAGTDGDKAIGVAFEDGAADEIIGIRINPFKI